MFLLSENSNLACIEAKVFEDFLFIPDLPFVFFSYQGLLDSPNLGKPPIEVLNINGLACFLGLERSLYFLTDQFLQV